MYDRVDIFSLATKKWRKGTPMLEALHGIFPVIDAAGNIWLVGGGVEMGNSQSTTTRVFKPN